MEDYRFTKIMMMEMKSNAGKESLCKKLILMVLYSTGMWRPRGAGVRTPQLSKIFAISQQKSVFLFKKKINRWENKVLHPPNF
jgi:hypothetical protein